MKQIRSGLENEMNVLTYANPSIDEFEMLKIRLELESKK